MRAAIHRASGKRRATPALGVWLALAAALAAAPAWTPSLTPASAAENGGKPRRIVSLELCADQLLIELGERDRIAAVTHLAADRDLSAIWEKARDLPVTRGAAEDVLRHRPDLVLAGPYGVAPTVDVLRRLGAKVVVVPMASDIEGVRTAVRVVADAIGEQARGEAMIADLDRRLAQIAAATHAAGRPEAAAPSAIIYQMGGAVSTAGSLADAALTAAGFRNKASEYRLTRAGQVPLELLVAAPPDVIVLASAADEYRTVLGDSLRHPALRRLREERTTVEVPWRLWLCGTPHVADAVELLARARAAIEARGR